MEEEIPTRLGTPLLNHAESRGGESRGRRKQERFEARELPLTRSQLFSCFACQGNAVLSFAGVGVGGALLPRLGAASWQGSDSSPVGSGSAFSRGAGGCRASWKRRLASGVFVTGPAELGAAAAAAAAASRAGARQLSIPPHLSLLSWSQQCRLTARVLQGKGSCQHPLPLTPVLLKSSAVQ